MQSERTIHKINEANYCGACLKPADKSIEPKRTLATHATTDAQQLGDGSWQESQQRFGCAEHKVVPMVILVDGTQIPYEEYVSASDN